MRIVTLIENTVGSKPLKCEHGLSIYVETRKHKLLLDTGRSGAAIDNAKALGVDIKNVDTVILSHGHYDHTGGVMRFALENPKAKIYMQKSGGKDYYSSYESRLLPYPAPRRIFLCIFRGYLIFRYARSLIATSSFLRF